MPRFQKMGHQELVERVLESLVNTNKLSKDTYTKLTDSLLVGNFGQICQYLNEVHDIDARYDYRTATFYIPWGTVSNIYLGRKPSVKRGFKYMLQQPSQVINRVLLELERAGIIDNTVFVACSRNLVNEAYASFLTNFSNAIAISGIELDVELRPMGQMNQHNAFVFSMSAGVAELLGILDPKDLMPKPKPSEGKCDSIW